MNHWIDRSGMITTHSFIVPLQTATYIRVAGRSALRTGWNVGAKNSPHQRPDQRRQEEPGRIVECVHDHAGPD